MRMFDMKRVLPIREGRQSARVVMRYWIGFFSVVVAALLFYFWFQTSTIYGGDGGDLVAAILTRGVAHPPGYPLYTALGVALETVIPFGTPAWRASFLSSIPSVAVLLLLYSLFYATCGSAPLAVLGAMSAGLTYPFWLYAVVPEVFALHSFFVVSILVAFYCWYRWGKTNAIRIGCFLVGLSLSHHHIILFFLPSLFFFFKARPFPRSKKLLFSCFFLLLMGIGLPYLYVFFSAAANPEVNWMGHATLSDFLLLVTRARYGTFRVGGFTAHEVGLRLASLMAFGSFVLKDFRILGILFSLAGIPALYFRDKMLFRVVFSALALSLFFLFYASFPLTDDFMVGTFERFLLMPYLYVGIFLFYGLIFFAAVLQSVFSRIAPSVNKYVLFRSAVFFLLALYPVSLFLISYPRFVPLRRDTTAERLGFDILNSMDPTGILIVSTDTPLFDTQYVYYANRLWPRVKLLHLAKLYDTQYRKTLATVYPDLSLPTSSGSGTFFQDFLKQNSGKFPIYSKQSFRVASGEWVPWGVLFRYIPASSPLTNETIRQKNKALWETYQNPLSGVLSTYRHLLLADIVRVYAVSHQETGYWLQKQNDENAERHFSEAIALYPQDPDAFRLLAAYYMEKKKCNEAKDVISRWQSYHTDDTAVLRAEVILYEGCFKDAGQASFYREKLVEIERKKTGLREEQ